MTDDEELRDDLGDELTAAMGARAREQQSPDMVETVQQRARGRRVRRWTATATVAAAIVVVIVAVTASGGSGKGLRVEESPTSTTTVTPGHRIVSYHGVHVEVPARWPVLDGMHTQFCGGPFGDEPGAYLGPNNNAPPSCPPPSPQYIRRRDGVWLDENATPDPRARTKTTASGAPVLESPREPLYSVRSVWFRGVFIEIGVGADPAVAQAIFDSIGYSDGVPDSPRSGICARSTAPTAMPTPERLSSRLVLEQGNVILDPPTPSDQAAVSPEDAWRRFSGYRDYEHYRLILARYTSAFPAEPNAEGVYVPLNRNVLAWVVYATPITKIAGCGMYIVDVSDATTGTGIGTLSYGPGP